MGGIGSGRRWHYGAKDTINDYRAIDARRWQRDGLLTPGNAFSWEWKHNGDVSASIQVRTETCHVVLKYRHRSNGGGGDWIDKNYPVLLDWTPCNLGGERAWFLCPARGCGRRVAILYGGAIFACRHCHQLAYPSQRETPDDRAARRAEKIRKRLGWEPGILNGNGWKPKGMHWKTFGQLTTRHDAFVQTSIAGMRARLNLIGESFDHWF